MGGFIRCSPAGYERAIRAFELEFPGITVSLTSDFSNVLNAKIEEQLRTKKVDTDLVILQTIQDLLAWNRRGQLLAFKPDGFDTIDARLKDRDGGWVAVNNNPIFYGYNKEQIRLIDVPRLATDFFQPSFKGKAHYHVSSGQRCYPVCVLHHRAGRLATTFKLSARGPLPGVPQR